MTPSRDVQTNVSPILLFNGECAVCGVIARWVQKSAKEGAERASIAVRPIGDDPDMLRSLNSKLDIWDAYETIHLLMPNGSMLLGGEAVAEVLRRLPNCRWFAWTFSVAIFGRRPFQWVLDVAYTVLSDIRPLLGCESCGIPGPFVKRVRAIFRGVGGLFEKRPEPRAHFTATPARSLKATVMASAAATH
jgi:predicted DCC family thiol-disulfide oxidoreductase YuxK